MNMKILLSILFLALSVGPAWAARSVDAIVEYTEPTTQACTPKPCTGDPINQLQHTTLYFEVRDGGGQVLDAWTVEQQATQPTGGGKVRYTLLPRDVSADSTVLMAWVSGSNPSGESLKTGPITKPIPLVDIGVPDRPIDLTITVNITVRSSIN